MQEESPELKPKPWYLDSFSFQAIAQSQPLGIGDQRFENQQSKESDPSFYEKLILSKKHFSFSLENEYDVGANSKAKSVVGEDEQQIASPLTFLPITNLRRQNSEMIQLQNFDHDNSRSLNFGDNKYIQHKEMIIEENEDDHHYKTPNKSRYQTPKRDKITHNITPKNVTPRNATPKSLLNNLDLQIRRNYEPIRFIGQGKLGKVYQVKSKIDQLFYAIKKIDLNDFDTISQSILRQNVQFLAKLNIYEDLHLVKFHDSQVHNDHLYIIMEHCEYSLRHINQKHIRVYETQIRRILMDICQILEVLQCQTQKTHSNINPGNILLSKNKRYKLGDFGLLNLPQNNNNWDKEIKYTPADGDDYHDKNDVYSIGVILYELMLEKELPKTQRLSNSMIQKLDLVNRYSQSLKYLIKSMVHPLQKFRPTVTDILKSLKLEIEEELSLLIIENECIQKEIKLLLPDRHRTHKKNSSF